MRELPESQTPQDVALPPPDTLVAPDDAHIDRDKIRQHDTIAFRHPQSARPVQARVTAIGKDGVTVRGNGKHQKVKVNVPWHMIAGHAPSVLHDPVDGVEGLPDPESSQWINKPKPLNEPEHEYEWHVPFAKSRAAASPRETMHEPYLRGLAGEYRQALSDACAHIQGVVLEWLRRRLEGDGIQGIEKSRAIPPRPVYLSQTDIDELAQLIRSFTTSQITGLPLYWPAPYARNWLAWRLHTHGVAPHRTVDLSRYMQDAFVFGRLQQILEQAQSLEDARRMAAAFPLDRATQLSMIAAQESAGNYVTGWGDKLIGAARDACIQHNRDLLSSLASAYLSGDLKAADTIPTGLSIQEQAWATGNQKVASLQALSLDLRRRWKALGDDRDWDRLAYSEVRRLSNIGAAESIAEAALARGVPLSDEKVYFLVAAGACDLCKRVYLDKHGQPISFALDALLQRIRETGGISIGDKAVPNALLHPWCACRLMRTTALGPVTTKAAPFMITRGRRVSAEQLER